MKHVHVTFKVLTVFFSPYSLQYLTTTSKILHSYPSQSCACKIMNRFSTTASSFITKNAFQNHAQATLDTSATDQSADLYLVSA